MATKIMIVKQFTCEIYQFTVNYAYKDKVKRTVAKGTQVTIIAETENDVIVQTLLRVRQITLSKTEAFKILSKVI